jgi:hypothetical protein
MVTGFFLGFLLLWSVIAFTSGRRNGRWRSEAHKLARSADLALPSNLEPVVTRYLRNRWAVGLPVGVAIAGVVAVASRTRPNGHLPWTGALLMLAATPALFIVLTTLPSMIVRWRARGTGRLAHLERLTLRDVTTRSERWGMVVAVTAACVTGALGFDSLSAPSSLAIVPALTALLAAGSGWWYARTSLSGRSAGSDVLELAWDDVLRVRKVREALLAVAFLLPIELLLIAIVELLRPLPRGTNGSHAGSLTFSLAVLVGVGIYAYARRENKVVYRSWRRLWPQTPPPIPSAGATG